MSDYLENSFDKTSFYYILFLGVFTIPAFLHGSGLINVSVVYYFFENLKFLFSSEDRPAFFNFSQIKFPLIFICYGIYCLNKVYDYMVEFIEMEELAPAEEWGVLDGVQKAHYVFGDRFKDFLICYISIFLIFSPVVLGLERVLGKNYISHYVRGYPDYSKITLEEIKSKAINVSYEQLARSPDLFKNKPIKIYGQVVQVLGQQRTLRIALTQSRFLWTDPVYVDVVGDKKIERLLDDDIVTAYGYASGEIEYKGLLGQAVTAPYIKAVWIVIGRD